MTADPADDHHDEDVVVDRPVVGPRHPLANAGKAISDEEARVNQDRDPPA
jgi:hypothetical protein